MNNSPSNLFHTLLSSERYPQNCQVVVAATGMNGFKVLQYTGGHNLFSIGRRRSPAVSTADIPLVSQGAFFQHIHASEPEH